jgi:hypothetical protein
MLHNLQLFHRTHLRTVSEHAQAISHVFSEQSWEWEIILVSPSVFRDCICCVQACSVNTLEWFPSVFSKRTANYEAFCYMRINLKYKYFFLNNQAKEKFKNSQRTLRKYWFNNDDKKGQNISCQSPFNDNALEG